MALTYGFYNSSGGDRKYDAVQMSSIFDGVIKDGVFEAIGDKLTVTASAYLNVSVGAGRAWFNHTWTNLDSAMLIAIELGDMINPRIDTIVLEVDSSDGVRANSIKVIKGTAAGSPSAPVLTNTSSVHQYPLANIAVGTGATEIVQGNITNFVGTSLCPYVIGAVASVSVDDLVAQWNSQFNTWFSNLRIVLAGDVAGNLQSEIDAIIGIDGGVPSIDLESVKEYPTHAHTGSPNGSAIGTAGIVNDAVDITKIGSGVAGVTGRQGGSGTNWAVPGNTNYTTANPRIEIGSFMSMIDGAGTEVQITFPVGFSDGPNVILSKVGGNTSNFYLSVLNKDYFKVIFSSGGTFAFNWLAIGPE